MEIEVVKHITNIKSNETVEINEGLFNSNEISLLDFLNKYKSEDLCIESVKKPKKKESNFKGIIVEVVETGEELFLKDIKSLSELEEDIKIDLVNINFGEDYDIDDFEYLEELKNINLDEEDKNTIYHEALKYSGYAINFIDSPTEIMQLIAIWENIENIQDIENPTETVQLAAVKENEEESFQYIKNPTIKVQREAILLNYGNIEYIDNPSEEILKLYKYCKKYWEEYVGEAEPGEEILDFDSFYYNEVNKEA